MSEPLKYMYNSEFVERLASALYTAHSAVDAPYFCSLVMDSQWDSLELKQRTRHIVHALGAVLPSSYSSAIEILMLVAPQFTGFPAIVFPDFVEVYGLGDYDVSIPALELFTQYSTAEYAVRPFIQRYPAMMEQMLAWSRHANHHVRRLASEGSRPRLPWGIALPEFKKDPAPVLPILEQLRADDSEYVRRSVANNLNDIAKDNPHIVLDIARRWKGVHPDTDRLVRHACRTLLKRAHPEALQLFGFDHVEADVRRFDIVPEVRIGGVLEFECELLTPSTEALRVEYAIGYVKSGGKISRKVFALAESALHGGVRVFKRRHSFRNMTTRTHYPGVHTLSILVNGRVVAEGEFLVQNPEGGA